MTAPKSDFHCVMRISKNLRFCMLSNWKISHKSKIKSRSLTTLSSTKVKPSCRSKIYKSWNRFHNKFLKANLNRNALSRLKHKSLKKCFLISLSWQSSTSPNFWNLSRPNLIYKSSCCINCPLNLQQNLWFNWSNKPQPELDNIHLRRCLQTRLHPIRTSSWYMKSGSRKSHLLPKCGLIIFTCSDQPSKSHKLKTLNLALCWRVEIRRCWSLFEIN